MSEKKKRKWHALSDQIHKAVATAEGWGAAYVRATRDDPPHKRVDSKITPEKTMMSASFIDLESEWTTCVSTQDGGIFYRNKVTGETRSRLGPQPSGSQIVNLQPPPINTGGDQTSPVKNEFSTDPKDADDEELL